METSSIQTDSERKRASAKLTVTHKNSDSTTIQRNKGDHTNIATNANNGIHAQQGAKRMCSSSRVKTNQEETVTNG